MISFGGGFGVPASRWVMSIDNIAALFEARTKRVAIGLVQNRHLFRVFRVHVVPVTLNDPKKCNVLQRAVPTMRAGYHRCSPLLSDISLPRYCRRAFSPLALPSLICRCFGLPGKSLRDHSRALRSPADREKLNGPLLFMGHVVQGR
jgi:hypothetical protein